MSYRSPASSGEFGIDPRRFVGGQVDVGVGLLAAIRLLADAGLKAAASP